MLAAEWGTGQVLWSMLYFFLFFIWIWMLIAVFADVFTSPDLSGWGKALWSFFVIVLPYLGVFTYLVARGRKMGEHHRDEMRQNEEMFRTYVHDVAGPSDVDQLSALASLRADGLIDDEEYARMKARVTAA